MSKREAPTDHFRRFATSLERVISSYGETKGDYYDRQKGQFDKLVALENELRTTLLAHSRGPAVYRAFVKFICVTKHNILAARPYFRERQTTFTKYIAQALKRRSHTSLYRFRFNYQFIRFMMTSFKWPPGSAITRLAKEIGDLRIEIMSMNMPLAISRARIFWSRTPKSHLTIMDLIQSSSEGLAAGLDKYCPPFSRVFRSVAIGRMVGNLIGAYSETQVHFYPTDKRKIYRANKMVHKHAGGVDFVRLADEVNKDFGGNHLTSPDEIAGLMAAASMVSADSINAQDPDAPEPISRFAAPDSCRPDLQVEQHDAMASMSVAIEQLSVFERKLLRLRGVAASLRY